jgi:hypothetical protein
MSFSSLLIDLIPATDNTLDAFQICEKIALFFPSVIWRESCVIQRYEVGTDYVDDTFEVNRLSASPDNR